MKKKPTAPLPAPRGGGTSEILRKAAAGVRDRVFKRLLYDSGFVASKTLYDAVKAVEGTDQDLGEHFRQANLITTGQLARLRKRTDWQFCRCPNCLEQYEIREFPEGTHVPCPKCKEPIPLPERTLGEGKLMMIKPRRIKDMILGKLAIQRGFIDRKQLAECLEAKAGENKYRELAQIFLDKDYVPREKIGELLAEHGKVLDEMGSYFRRLEKEIALAEKLISGALVGTDEMNLAIEEQSRAMARGQSRTLVSVLVALGALTKDQLAHLEEGRVERLVACPKCSAIYRVRDLDPARRFLCRSCGEVIGGEAPAVTRTAEEAELAASGPVPAAAPAAPPPSGEEIPELKPLDEAEAAPARPAPKPAGQPPSKKRKKEPITTVKPMKDWSRQVEKEAVELKPIEESTAAAPAAKAAPAGGGAEEPDPGDFLDEDFMHSDYLEPVDPDKLSKYNRGEDTRTPDGEEPEEDRT